MQKKNRWTFPAEDDMLLLQKQKSKNISIVNLKGGKAIGNK